MSYVFPDELHRPLQVYLDGIGGNAEIGGDLIPVHAVESIQLVDQALSFGEVAKGLVQKACVFLVGEAIFYIRPGGQGGLEMMYDGGSLRFPFDVFVGGVGYYPVEPPPQIVRDDDIPFLPELQKRFLYDILSHGLVPGDVKCSGKEPERMGMYDFTDLIFHSARCLDYSQ